MLVSHFSLLTVCTFCNAYHVSVVDLLEEYYWNFITFKALKYSGYIHLPRPNDSKGTGMSVQLVLIPFPNILLV